MIAYKIEQTSTNSIYLTSDLKDVFDTIGKVSDGTPVLITTKELTVSEFENELKMIAINNQTISKL